MSGNFLWTGGANVNIGKFFVVGKYCATTRRRLPGLLRPQVGAVGTVGGHSCGGVVVNSKNITVEGTSSPNNRGEGLRLLLRISCLDHTPFTLFRRVRALNLALPSASKRKDLIALWWRRRSTTTIQHFVLRIPRPHNICFASIFPYITFFKASTESCVRDQTVPDTCVIILCSRKKQKPPFILHG